MKEEQFFEALGNIDNRFIENPRPASGKRWVRGILWKIILVIVILSLVSIICLYVLYNNNPYYTIEKIDGEYFMVGKQPWTYSKDFGCHYWPTYRFDSPAEMKRKLLECDFTKQELEGLYHVLLIEPGKLKLLDLDHYRLNYSKAESMEIRYVLESGGREYLVEETYYEKNQYTSIYLREGDCYDQISVSFAQPSVEWITSFGLTPVQ